MSTEAQPPSPPQHIAAVSRFLARPAEKQQSRGPPIAFDTQGSRRRHGRSSSLGEVFSRMLPSRRSEKGHTLRPDIETQADIGEGLFSLPTNKSNLDDSTKGKPLKSKTWSPASRSEHESGEKQKGAIKRLIGSIRSVKNSARAKYKRSQEDSIDETTKITCEDAEFQHGLSGSLRPPQVQRLSSRDTVDYYDEKEITKTQQLFEDKKARREQRRSLQESGDFLGVQGANPRTGYWDISDVTSSSEPSQASEEARQLLAKQAREVAEKKRRYEEAQVMQQTELKRVQALRDAKKRDKLEQKRRELKMRQRGRGKWRLSENGWSSLAEPDLSPIEQSLAGSPVAEIAPADRLYPMPSADHPSPYEGTGSVAQPDYFGKGHTTSPLARDHPSRGSGTISTESRQKLIPRKPVGSLSRRATEGSTSTIVHTTSGVRTPPNSLSAGNLPKREDMKPSREGQDSVVPTTPNPFHPGPRPFLGQKLSTRELSGHQEREAIAISYRSASTSQVQIRQRLGPSREDTSPAKRIMSLNELPPVFIKDPIAARNPLSSQPPKPSFPVWSPPTILETLPDQEPSFTSTFITTTTGFAPHQRLPIQMDGVNEIISVAQAKDPALPYKINCKTSGDNSPQKQSPRALQNHECQTLQADIVTSSEHQLTPTKQRIARLCRVASAEGEKIELKTIPTSTSMSRQSLPKQKETARNAAQLAFRHLRQSLAPNRSGPANNTSNRALKKPGEQELKELCPMPKMGSIASACALVSTQRSGGGDHLVVRHPEPTARAKKAGMALAGKKGTSVQHVPRHMSLSPAKRLPRPPPPRRPLTIWQAVADLVFEAWMLIEPVFNSQSAIRKRFDQQSLTFQDIALFLAAGLFMIGIFLLTVVFARLVGMALQAVKTLGVVFGLLTGV